MNKFVLVGLVVVLMGTLSACRDDEDKLAKEREAKALESQKRAKAAEDYYFGKTKERPSYSEEKK